MAKMYPGMGDGIRGKIDGISIYKMKGVDRPVVRRSSGHSRAKQKRDPRLDLFCRAGKEFGGRSVIVGHLNWALRLHKCCRDHNVTAPLNGILSSVQVLDGEGDLGERSIFLSQHKEYVKGYSLNRTNPFDSVVTLSPQCSINRETLTATLRIPALIPNVNFFPSMRSPFYRFIATMTAVPDVVWKNGRYVSVFDKERSFADADSYTNWFSLLEGSPTQEIVLSSNDTPPNENYTLVVTVGVCYGILKTLDEVEMLPYGGSGKILEVG
ncbi:hypothetical protein [Paraflavitalea pollutisoli]|uniref:hypothetical protein n=1 Tax=Paraflavitalea pollutisoli TaxID=3034143 RepID=UPI0023EC1B24|nr:hypothetical protein [Paraflavitalea sp. H1-2-19X]